MTLTPRTRNDLTFRVKPRLLTLLGEQLIRDANLAVFELVKNAYDADATMCVVTLENPDNPATGRILIEDDGSGMTEQILRDVWMVIATDFKLKQRSESRRSPKFNRFPLGEKGLGRLSIHKLGHYIRLVTRAPDSDEIVMDFDWDAIEGASELDEAFVRLTKRKPEIFTDERHGTKFEVTRLRETWSRGELRRLYRSINSLCSPFQGPTDFEVILSAPGKEDWLKGMFTAEDANQCAVYHARGSFQDTTASLTYSFTPPEKLSQQLQPRKEQLSNIQLQKKDGRKILNLDLSQHRIGKVDFEFWLFDRDSSVLRMVTADMKGLKDYLDENGGIRIYRDGIRVYDFGEPGNDWLNLDLRRVNTPTARTSNNQILAALRLDSVTSTDLREKTNREGFIENTAFADFREAVLSVLTQVEAEKGKDQKRLREATGKNPANRVFDKLNDIREALQSRGLLAEFEPVLKQTEKELEIYKDQLLHAAVPGLTIGMMLHGAEKILDELRAATQTGDGSDRIRDLVDRLYRAMRPVTNLLKNPTPTKTTAFSLIKEAIFSVEIRLQRHGIQLLKRINEDSKDFRIEGSKQMLVASITNLFDNSIHWLDSKNPTPKLIYIGTTKELEGGPAILVADNGPGFGTDTPEDLIEPFFSRRLGGMGLGLYITNEVMSVHKGRLLFPTHDEVSLPDEIDGAIVALQFEEKK